MLKYTLTALLLLTCLIIEAQGLLLKGQILDVENLPLIGANVQLLLNGEVSAQTISDAEGQFQMSDISPSVYRLKVSYLGFYSINKDVAIDSDHDLGTLTMYASAVALDEVLVKGKVPLATQQGDTTSYNASQFKVLADASTEDLVRKMPGVVIENGQIQAEGENVQQVLVDGKPFFGNDPNAALKNLPAEVVDKIEVFDQKSEQAQFTGFDDGQTTKTINIVTKVDNRNGQFGRAYAGLGSELHYNTGGNFSIFNDDQRISFIGQANDINIQNFSSEDILGISGNSGRRGRSGRRGGGNQGFQVPQQPGISATNALGVNFSDDWGEKMDATFSYFVNQNSTVSEEILQRQFFNAEGNANGDIYNERNSSLTNNLNHRLNGEFEYEINEFTGLEFRPNLSYQSNNGSSTSLGATYADALLVNDTENFFNAEDRGLSLNNRLLLRHRFGESRRTLSFNVQSAYSQQNGASNLFSSNRFFAIMETEEEIDQIANLEQDGWNNSANVVFTNPAGEKGMVSIEYRINLENEDASQETLSASENGLYDQLEGALSSVFQNQYTTHTGGVSYNYRMGKSTIISRANLQYAQLNTSQTFPTTTDINRNFLNVLPFVMWRYNIDRQNNLRVIYRTNTVKPSVSQLQEVVDNTNPLQLSIGNSALNQQFQHSLFARIRRVNSETGNVFFAYLGGNITQNYIGSSLYTARSTSDFADQFNLQTGSQITQQINLNGYWNFRGFLTYGIPVSALKSNLNLNLSGNFSNTPSLIDEVLNNAQNSTYGLGVSLTSNISDKIDFTISSSSNYSTLVNDLNTNLDATYFNQRSSLKLDWILPADIVFRTDLNNQLFTGLAEDFNQGFWIWNLAIGKKVFKNKLGEFNISIYDLLNQNQRINREVTGNYFEDISTNVLQRYVMVNFIYNFRNFGDVKTVEQNDRRRGFRGPGF